MATTGEVAIAVISDEVEITDVPIELLCPTDIVTLEVATLDVLDPVLLVCVLVLCVLLPVDAPPVVAVAASVSTQPLIVPILVKLPGPL